MTEVIKFPKINYRNIPASLRSLADEIEQGKTPGEGAVVILDYVKDGKEDISVIDYGELGHRDIVYLLNWALQAYMNIDEGEDGERN